MSAVLRIYAPEASAITSINPPVKKPVRKSVRWVWRKHLRPEMVKNGRAVSTIKEIELHLSRYESYWRKSRMLNPCVGGSSPPGGAKQEVAQTREPWKFPGLFAFLGGLVLESFLGCASFCDPSRSLTAPENAPDFSTLGGITF